ncbi:hypothetical protein ES705_46622 [subsurface metagenome]
MADRLAELIKVLEGMSPENLKRVAEFAKCLKWLQDNGVAH